MTNLPLRGVVRWMMVRVVVWPVRYRRAAVGADEAEAVLSAAELLAGDAAAELRLELDDVLRLAAERVFVWLGRHRVAPRTYRAALACLPLVVLEQAGVARVERSHPPTPPRSCTHPSIIPFQSGAASARSDRRVRCSAEVRCAG